jgi:predicted PurR-regulated permease PerM
VADRRSYEIPRTWTWVLVIAAGVLLSPFAGWIILAIWLSGFARGLHERLTRRLNKRVHLAAFITVVLLLMVLVPIGVVVTMLVIDSIALITNLAESDKVHSILTTLVADKNPNPEASIGELLMMQGTRAWSIAQVILTSAIQIVIGLVILIAGIYALLIDGRRWYAWAEDHLPVGPVAWRRISEAFVETGRGLMFSIAGAGFLQAIAATLAFVILEVPQALPLGLLTLIFSIVPIVGTALVWGPVAVGLALTGRLYEGIGLGLYGAFVIGSLDNIARPFLAKYGHLKLPGFVVLVAMFGGVELLGGWGILFGPLVVRLAKEALEVRHDLMCTHGPNPASSGELSASSPASLTAST